MVSGCSGIIEAPAVVDRGGPSLELLAKALGRLRPPYEKPLLDEVRQGEDGRLDGAAPLEKASP